MPEQAATLPAGLHGALRLPRVEVDSYSLELRDHDGFLGDRASRSAFHVILENWRKAMRKTADDPFGDEPSDEISKKELDSILTEGDLEAAGVLEGTIEDFAKELAHIVRRFLKTKGWRDTERIVIGGGLRGSRVGELCIGRAAVILKTDGIDIDVRPIRNDPDEAGLLGAPQLAPSWVFHAYDAILAVDIGGSNIRAGIVELNLKKAADFSKAAVWKFDLWHYGDEQKLKRDDAVEGLTGMLEKLIGNAKKEDIRLAPFIGIGCPGRIREDGSIERGAQNLPGNWESRHFNLPNSLCTAIPRIGEHETVVAMHNDAVVQALSEVPCMQDVERWGILTIGTGLGNARFTNRKPGA